MHMYHQKHVQSTYNGNELRLARIVNFEFDCSSRHVLICMSLTCRSVNVFMFDHSAIVEPVWTQHKDICM